MALPEDLTDLRDMIEELGGFHELDYISVVVLDEFTVVMDFSRGQIRIESKELDLLNSLVGLWKLICTLIDISGYLASLAIPIEGKRFILFCLNEDGSLSETPDGIVTLNYAYMIPVLEQLEMDYIIKRFAEFLIKIQNSDGGWGPEPGLESQILPTAGAVLVLTTTSAKTILNRNESIRRGVNFLLSKQNKDGSWAEGEERGMISAICYIALRKYEKYEEYEKLATKSLPFIRKWISEFDPTKYDFIIIKALKEVNIIGNQDIKSIYERLWSKIVDYDYFLRTANVITITFLINLLLEIGVNPQDPKLRSAIDLLIRRRNSDGGWPINKGERSNLYPTILSLATFKTLLKRKYYV